MLSVTIGGPVPLAIHTLGTTQVWFVQNKSDRIKVTIERVDSGFPPV